MANRYLHFLNDRPTINDLFDYDVYVKALVNMVVELSTYDRPLVIGIYGPWGSGKTSLMQMIEDKLRIDYKYPVIWFNAWKYDKEDELWAAFLQTILSHLKLSGNIFQRIFNRIRLFVHAINWKSGAWSLINQFLPIVIKGMFFFLGIYLLTNSVSLPISFLGLERLILPDTLKKISLGLGAALTTIGFLSLRMWSLLSSDVQLDLDAFRTENKFKEKVAFLDGFAKELEYMLKILNRPERPLTIMIDDLDRCLPEKVVGVLEALNLFIGDQANCLFFLAADRDFVENAIYKHYTDFAKKESTDKAFGQNYLEKVVQFPFSIPPISQRSVINFIVLNQYYDNETKKLAELFSFGLQANPRQIKRVLRIFHLNRQISIQRTDKLDLTVLAIITMIQYRWPDVFLYLSRKPSFLGMLQNYMTPDSSGTDLEAYPELKNVLKRFSSYADLRRLLLSEKCPTLTGRDLTQYIFITQISGHPDKWVSSEDDASSELTAWLNSCQESILIVLPPKGSTIGLYEQIYALINLHQIGVLVRVIFPIRDNYNKYFQMCQDAGIETRQVSITTQDEGFAILDRRTVISIFRSSRDPENLRLHIQSAPAMIADSAIKFEMLWEQPFKNTG